MAEYKIFQLLISFCVALSHLLITLVYTKTIFDNSHFAQLGFWSHSVSPHFVLTFIFVMRFT